MSMILLLKIYVSLAIKSSKLDPAIVFLGSSTDDKVYLLTMISKSIAQKPYHAGELVKVAAKIAVAAGGRPDMAQARKVT